MDGCLGKSSVCALSQIFPWLVLGEEMEVVRSHPRFRPWVAVKTSGQPDELSSSEMDDLHSLSSAACFFGLEFTDKLECMDEWFGLPRSRHLSETLSS